MSTISDMAQLITALVVLGNAIGTAYTFIQTRRNGKKSDRIEANVKTIEIATNSMKDALVAATAKASLAEGTAAGLAQGRGENADQPPVKVDIVKLPPGVAKE